MTEKKTPQQALPLLQQYCSYQERCHREVKDRLAAWGIFGSDADAITGKLIEENYLNEERFAIQFAGGKFRVKKWGRVKIRYELKARQVGDYCIRRALQEIDPEQYAAILHQLAEAKWQATRSDKSILIRQRKTANYLISKGYEADMVHETLKQLSKNG